MLHSNIHISEETGQILISLASKTGKPVENVLDEAVNEYALHHSNLSRDERLLAGKGLWKDRKDLPDFDELRKSFDRT
jgi:hypothetical protein